MSRHARGRWDWSHVVLALTVVALALVTVHLQVTGLRMVFLETEQAARHAAVLNGTAPNPWQYRVLAELVIEALAWIPRQLGVSGGLVLTFIGLRVLQNAAVLALAYAYFRRLSVPPATAIIGLNLLALAMLQADIESDLSFNTYFDVIFYLLAGLAVLEGRWMWIVPVTAFAALNRETSALIPLMPLAAWSVKPLRPILVRTVALSALAYVAVYIGVRYWYGPRPLMLGWGHELGLDLLLFNMRRYGWVRFIATMGTLPILAAVGYRNWPRELKAFGWLIVPIWMVVHLLASVITETRLYLVPLVLVILPGCLLIDAVRARVPAVHERV